jgi:hypothetical protein
MSTYRGHIIGGIIAYALTAPILSGVLSSQLWPWYAHPFFIGAALLGALFPDIDTRSTIQRFFFIALIPLLPFSLFYSKTLFIFLGIICIVALFIPHRTLTHNPWFIITLTAVMIGIILTRIQTHHVFLVRCCIYFCAGALSHWFLDFGLRRLFPKK